MNWRNILIGCGATFLVFLIFPVSYPTAVGCAPNPKGDDRATNQPCQLAPIEPVYRPLIVAVPNSHKVDSVMKQADMDGIATGSLKLSILISMMFGVFTIIYLNRRKSAKS